MKIRFSLLTLICIMMLPAAAALAQSGDFQIANRLMQQQNYEEALPILEELHQNNPSAHVFFDRYVDCLVQLDEVDRAEAVARRQVENEYNLTQSAVKLAEILHTRGERDEAREFWQMALDRNSGNIQAYYNVASSMNRHREYNAAIEVYRQAREEQNSRTLFLNEMANTYMQAGRFEEAVTEYYRLVIESPEQMGLVQQRFLQMRDDALYEVAAFELEDLLFELDTSHTAYSQLYQLLIWLLLETEEYNRAGNFARYYERNTSHTIYSLFSLGNQLRSAGQFEPAAEAFRYYVDEDTGSNRFRAMEELSGTYENWARYLEQNNLETPQRHRELYNHSYELSEMLIEDAPNYDRADRILSRLIDLSLDRFKDAEKARKWFDMLREHPDADEAFTRYAEGRLALFDENFLRARQALTRADRATDASNLSERSRYYLSLSDFFAGDFEFAEIQLQSLERRHTSFYANDAIKLRMWIKNGLRADTTGATLQAIGSGLYAIHKGAYEEAPPHFESILSDPGHFFSDDLAVEISTLLPDDFDHLKLQLLERQIEAQPHSPLLERMMWDRAVLAEKIYLAGGEQAIPASPFLFDFLEDSKSFDYDAETITNLFEEILMQFPDGFYAPYVRQKLQQMESTILS